MFKFRKARSDVLNELDEYLQLNSGELVLWLEREARSFGEFSYEELAALIASGDTSLINWQSRYAQLVNDKFNPAWLAAIQAGSFASTRGRITIYDSDFRVKEFLRTRGAEFVTQLSDESKRAVAAIILRGQSENLRPLDIAKLIRPLIGLNARQADANLNYRAQVLNKLIDAGLSPSRAAIRADKSAATYAAKQHKYRAETIVHTELARAYNQGAFDGVKAAVDAKLMPHCEMIWSTAGTNRVCGRCLSLKDTVVGHTNEVGVTLPPLHPRCRCVIVYRELTSRSTRGTMSSKEPPHWPPRDRTKIISKDEHARLREFAQMNEIALIGVKKFDGSPQVVQDILETLVALKNEFPRVGDARHKLELELSIFLDANDYAETVRRTIKLNANAYRDVRLLAREYQKDVDAGWFVKGTTWRAIIHHEFGHVVANAYNLDPLKIACEITKLDPKATLAYLETELSLYAGGFANGQEIISEVFADMSTGSPSNFSRDFYGRVRSLTR